LLHYHKIISSDGAASYKMIAWQIIKTIIITLKKCYRKGPIMREKNFINIKIPEHVNNLNILVICLMTDKETGM
jgi:hypothetical protein